MVNAAIVHALTDLGFWASVFFGYVMVEIFVTSSRLKKVVQEIDSTNRELAAANQRIDQLEARLVNLSKEVLR